MTEHRIPQDLIDKARAIDVGEVAARYGFALTSRQGEHVGPCPGCGGHDRFSVNTKSNVWRCRQGGGDPIGGDAVALVRHVEGCGFLRAIEIVTGQQFTPREPTPATQKRDDNEYREKERRRAYELWREGHAFADGGPVDAYLRRRGIAAAFARMPGAHCREHRDFPFWQPYTDAPVLQGRRAKVKWRIIHRGPAMLWPIVDAAGSFMGLHVTWLDPSTDNGKAEIFCPDTGEQLPAKKVRGSKKGGRIVLRTTSLDVGALAVGEGVESCLSWLSLGRHLPAFHGCGVETSVDLGNLAGRAARTVAHPVLNQTRRDGRVVAQRYPGPDPLIGEDQALLWSPPAGTKRLMLIGDADSEPYATRAALKRATARLDHLLDEIADDWPPAGHDFNSLLMETA